MNKNPSVAANISPPRQPYPAVSVVIPLYNAEKYISECLNSLLAQTFQNFEVIVVDDCSTDSSCTIVENYREKFDERLTLSHMDKNSGSGALPRNKGMMLSRGEYIAFLDNDDLYTKTALEELYTLAKDFDADVVYCEDNYRVHSNGTGIHKEFGDKIKPINKPTFESDNLVERVSKILHGKYHVPQWCKLVRRSFIFEQEIFFPDTRPSDDDIWTYGLIFHAKKFLRVPNITYIRRLTEDSIMRVKKTPQQVITFWSNPVLLGLKSLDNLMSRHEFFQKNPQYRYAVLQMFVNNKLNIPLKDSFQLQPFVIYEILKQEFGAKLGEQDVLIAALCTAFNTQQKINVVNIQQFQQFAAQAQARIAQLEAEVNRLKSKE